MYLKNTASQKLEVFAFDYSTGAPKTADAANLTAYVNIDDAGYNALTDTSATEVDSTNKKGLYVFDLTQGETNGTKLAFTCKSSTANVSVIPRVSGGGVDFTQPATGLLAPATAGRTLVVDASGLADANTVKVGPTGSGTAQTARDLGLALPAVAAGASGGLLISGSNSGTTTLGALTVSGATTLTGAVSLGSTLTVTGTTTLAALAMTTLTASGAVAFQSTFAVTTSTALGALSASTVTFSGAVAFQSTFIVTGATTFTGAITGSNASNNLRINGVVPGAAGGLFIAGTNAATTITTALTTTFTGNLTGSVASVSGDIGGLAAGAITDVEDAVWDAVLASHLDAGSTGFALNAAGSAGDPWGTALPGAYTSGTAGWIVGHQLGGTFTTASSSIFSTAALANAPTGGSAPTVGQIATAVWQDTTAGDFTVSGSIGKSLFTSGNAPGAASGLAIVGSNMGTVTTVSGNVTGSIGSLATQAKADVNGEVVDVLSVDTFSELAADPGVSPTVVKALMLLYMGLRNKVDVTASAKEVHNNAGAVLLTKALSDDGTVYSEAKMA